MTNKLITKADVIPATKAKLAANQQDEALLWKGWNEICDAIEARALQARIKPKSFEIHHETETARYAYLLAYCNGKSIVVAKNEGLKSIKLGVDIT